VIYPFLGLLLSLVVLTVVFEVVKDHVTTSEGTDQKERGQGNREDYEQYVSVPH